MQFWAHHSSLVGYIVFDHLLQLSSLADVVETVVVVLVVEVFVVVVGSVVVVVSVVVVLVDVDVVEVCSAVGQ